MAIRSFLAVVFSVPLASAITVACFWWERRYDAFDGGYGAIRIGRGEGEYEFCSGPSEWDKAIGIVPWAYYHEWLTAGEVRSERIRVDYPRAGLSVLASGLSWWFVGLTIIRYRRTESTASPRSARNSELVKPTAKNDVEK